jgi:hypothetical protein
MRLTSLRVCLLSALIALGAAACNGDDAGTSASGGASGSGASGSGGGTRAGTAGGGGAVADAHEEAVGNAGAGGGDDARTGDRNDTDGSATDVTAPEPEADVEAGSDTSEAAPQDSGSSEARADAIEGGTSAKVCVEACNVDQDCAIDSGVQKVRCHPVTHRCATCVEDITCIASRSFWTAKPCTVDVDCVNDGGFTPFGDVCIDIGGAGYCAFLATSTTNCTAVLNTPTFSTFAVKKFGSTDSVEVCGKPSRCDADRGSCQNPCTSNTSCTPARGGKICNTGAGRCECGGDGDCGPGAPTCNLAIRQCECSSGSDCPADASRPLTCQ